jgi:hypothetical protein
MQVSSANESIIKQWVNENLKKEEVEKQLLALGYDKAAVEAQLLQYQKEKMARKQFNGFVYLGVGAFISFVSCVLAMMNLLPGLTNWILFGLTTVGILVICKGLYNVFE